MRSSHCKYQAHQFPSGTKSVSPTSRDGDHALWKSETLPLLSEAGSLLQVFCSFSGLPFSKEQFQFLRVHFRGTAEKERTPSGISTKKHSSTCTPRACAARKASREPSSGLPASGERPQGENRTVGLSRKPEGNPSPLTAAGRHHPK